MLAITALKLILSETGGAGGTMSNVTQFEGESFKSMVLNRCTARTDTVKIYAGDSVSGYALEDHRPSVEVNWLLVYDEPLSSDASLDNRKYIGSEVVVKTHDNYDNTSGGHTIYFYRLT